MEYENIMSKKRNYIIEYKNGNKKRMLANALEVTGDFFILMVEDSDGYKENVFVGNRDSISGVIEESVLYGN